MKKSYFVAVAIILLMASLNIAILSHQEETSPELTELPTPELSEGLRGELGIDKNINESTLDDYIGRSDIVFRDMRMLKDEAEYENIGGDSYLSGFVKGFEVVPYPLLAPVEGLPEEVGKSYSGKTLFRKDQGAYVANYEESYDILEYLFPKDNAHQPKTRRDKLPLHRKAHL